MKRVFLVISSFIILFLVCLYLLLKPYHDLYRSISTLPISNLLFDRNLPELDSKVKFILLGISGGDHDVPDLTDLFQLVNLD